MSDVAPVTTLAVGNAPAVASAPIISARGLSKRYQLGKNNFVDALRGATLDIRQGEMAAIMGPSGSGKSTFKIGRASCWERV